MYEDKLTPEQRLRLECVAQAQTTLVSNQPLRFSSLDVIKIAKNYESYINGEEISNGK